MTMEVLTPTWAFGWSPSTTVRSGEPGQVVIFTVSITHTGNVADSYALSLSSHAWIAFCCEIPTWSFCQPLSVIIFDAANPNAAIKFGSV